MKGLGIGKLLLWIIVGILVLLAVSLYFKQFTAVREGEDLFRTIARY